MNPAILFDLDDTLLDTNMGAFLPAYFESLGAHMAHLASPDQLINQLMIAVRAMENNQDPNLTLKTVFDRHFYEPLGAEQSEWHEILDNFYKEKFPKLKSIVQRKPEARGLIDWCRARGYTLAIATNPLFPKAATLQRMAWAGLRPEEFIFVSTYEDFHFTKPNLSYYAEAIGRMGWPEGPIPMIGDNLTHDLLPMAQLGHPTFWVHPDKEKPQQPSGDLTKVKRFLRSLQKEKGPGLVNDPDVWMAILRATPAVMDTWVEMIPDEIWQERPEDHEWCLVEIFWHLADIEQKVNLPQWRHLLETPDQPLPAIDTERWAEMRDYRSKDPVEALESFIDTRRLSLKWIIRLMESDIFEAAIYHPIFTRTTIQELVKFACRHDVVHLRQCSNLLNIYKMILLQKGHKGFTN